MTTLEKILHSISAKKRLQSVVAGTCVALAPAYADATEHDTDVSHDWAENSIGSESPNRESLNPESPDPESPESKSLEAKSSEPESAGTGSAEQESEEPESVEKESRAPEPAIPVSTGPEAWTARRWGIQIFLDYLDNPTRFLANEAGKVYSRELKSYVPSLTDVTLARNYWMLGVGFSYQLSKDFEIQNRFMGSISPEQQTYSSTGQGYVDFMGKQMPI
jgi:hypothetical protein